MSNKKIVLRGYATPRKFGPYFLPIPAQNQLYRSYALQLGGVFALSVNEFAYDECFLTLDGLINQAERDDHFVFCSLAMLPDHPAMKIEYLTRMVSKQCVLHFIFERVVVSTQSDIQKLVCIWKVKNIVRQTVRI